MRRTTKFSVLVATVAALSMFFGGIALGDSIELSTTSASHLPGGGGSFVIYLHNDDSVTEDISGCNAGGNTDNDVTISFSSSAPSVVAAPASVTLTACGLANGKTVNYTVASGATAGATAVITPSAATASEGKTKKIDGVDKYGIFSPADTLTVTVLSAAPVKQNQTITFTQPTTPATYGSTFTVAPTASSNLPVTLSASGACEAVGFVVTMTAGTGSCVLTARQTGSTGYNAAADVSQTVVAAAKAASVTPNAAGKTYGEADPALTGLTSGFLAGDNVTASFGRVVGEDAGSYAISATLSPPAVLSNYDITYNTASFTISRKAASVTPNAASKTYGDADPTLTGSTSGFLGGDNVTASYGRVAGETVAGGPYTISATLSPAAVLSNYDITYNTASFTISRKAASVTPNAASKTYGDADPTLTGSTDGFLGGDNVTASYTRAAGENAGSYAISATLSPAGVLGNYDITNNTANFTIDTRALTVTADAKSKFFGEADPALTWQLTSGNVVGTDVISGSLTRAAGTAPGQYAIAQGSLTAGDNYRITYVGANLTINSWATKGFYSPVDMGTATTRVFNTVKGGSTVPLKFEVFAGAVGSNEVKTVEAAGASIARRTVDCASNAVLDEIEIVSSGSTALRFDTTGDQFVYNWKTPTGVGCHETKVTLADGSTIVAYFKTR